MATKKNTSTQQNFNSYRSHPPVPASCKTYSYLYRDGNGNPIVPAGQYKANIDKIIDSKTNETEKEALDIFYTLLSKNGKKYYVSQRIPNNTIFMDNFLDFLVNAGVNPQTDPKAFSGNVGTVYVTYQEDKKYGAVVYSKPVVINHSPKKASSMQELLAEDDEDEDEVEDEVEVEPDENEGEVEADDLEEEDIEEYLEEEE